MVDNQNKVKKVAVGEPLRLHWAITNSGRISPAYRDSMTARIQFYKDENPSSEQLIYPDQPTVPDDAPENRPLRVELDKVFLETIPLYCGNYTCKVSLWGGRGSLIANDMSAGQKIEVCSPEEEIIYENSIIDFRVTGLKSEDGSQPVLLLREMADKKYGTDQYYPTEDVVGKDGSFTEFSYPDSEEYKYLYWGQITPKANALFSWKVSSPPGSRIFLTINRKVNSPETTEPIDVTALSDVGDGGLLSGSYDHLHDGQMRMLLEADLLLLAESGAQIDCKMIRLRENREHPTITDFWLESDGERNGKIEVGKPIVVGWKLAGQHRKCGLELRIFRNSSPERPVFSEQVRPFIGDGVDVPAGNSSATGSKTVTVSHQLGLDVYTASLILINNEGKAGESKPIGIAYGILGADGSAGTPVELLERNSDFQKLSSYQQDALRSYVTNGDEQTAYERSFNARKLCPTFVAINTVDDTICDLFIDKMKNEPVVISDLQKFVILSSFKEPMVKGSNVSGPDKVKAQKQLLQAFSVLIKGATAPSAGGTDYNKKPIARQQLLENTKKAILEERVSVGLFFGGEEFGSLDRNSSPPRIDLSTSKLKISESEVTEIKEVYRKFAHEVNHATRVRIAGESNKEKMKDEFYAYMTELIAAGETITSDQVEESFNIMRKPPYNLGSTLDGPEGNELKSALKYRDDTVGGKPWRYLLFPIPDYSPSQGWNVTNEFP